MKKIKIILFIILVFIVIVGSLAYFDYVNAKASNTSPKLSIKSELDEDSVVYKAILYKVWYCKNNKTYTIGSYSDKDAICPKNYVYDEDGYYTNALNVKISKRDLQLLTITGIYTSEMIENMNSEKQVESAVHVAYNYGINKYKETDKTNIVILPEFTLKDGQYKWVYDEENLYCLNGKEYSFSLAKYENDKCGTYEKVKMDKQWCDSYENSTLVYEEGIDKLCEE